MLPLLLTKMLKTEFWVTLTSLAAMLLGPKLGVPSESLSEFFMCTSGLGVAYVGQRGLVKAKAQPPTE